MLNGKLLDSVRGLRSALVVLAERSLLPCRPVDGSSAAGEDDVRHLTNLAHGFEQGERRKHIDCGIGR